MAASPDKAPRGRPLRFKSAKELTLQIAEYFLLVDGGKKVPTISGLANWLDVDPATVRDYEKREDDFALPIKRAFGLIEEFWESKLAGTACTGSIFWLKNRGWKDDHSFDHTSKGEQIKSIEYIAPTITVPSVVLTPPSEGADMPNGIAAAPPHSETAPRVSGN